MKKVIPFLCLVFTACETTPTPVPSPSASPQPIPSEGPSPVPSVTPSPAPSVTPTATPTPSSTPIAKGWLGINLSSIRSYEPDFMFTNQMHRARPWIAGTCDGKTWDTQTPIPLDASLYPTSLPAGICPHTLLMDTNRTYPGGTYTVRWDGAGTLSVRQDGKNWKSLGAGHATFDVTPTSAGIDLMITKTPVTNLRVYLPGYDNVDEFLPESLALMKHYGAIRFMDWHQANGSPLKNWADRPHLGDAYYSTIKGVPIEWSVKLANELGVHMWITTPHQATDDFITQMATLIKSQLKPGLKVLVEMNNETWNSQFPQAAYVIAQGKALGLPGSNDYEKGRSFHAQRSAEVGKLFRAVLGDRVVVILGAQAASSYWSGKMLAYLKSKNLSVDALAIAPYFGHRIGDADNSSWSLDKVFEEIETKSLPEVAGWIQANAAIAKQYGVKLYAYEAGQHLVGVGAQQNNQKLTDLFIAANADPRMGTMVTKLLNSWKQNGGDVLMYFNHMSRWTKFGSWGLRRSMEENTAKYEAVKNAK